MVFCNMTPSGLTSGYQWSGGVCFPHCRGRRPFETWIDLQWETGQWELINKKQEKVDHEMGTFKGWHSSPISQPIPVAFHPCTVDPHTNLTFFYFQYRDDIFLWYSVHLLQDRTTLHNSKDRSLHKFVIFEVCT